MHRSGSQAGVDGRVVKIRRNIALRGELPSVWVDTYGSLAQPDSVRVSHPRAKDRPGANDAHTAAE
jgi:hypothetical protein